MRKRNKPVLRTLRWTRRNTKPGPYLLGNWFSGRFPASELRIWTGSLEQIVAEHKAEFKTYPGGFSILTLQDKHTVDIVGETLIVWPGILETIHPREYSGPKIILKANRTQYITQEEVDGIVEDIKADIGSRTLGNKWGYPMSTIDNIREGKTPVFAKNSVHISAYTL